MFQIHRLWGNSLVFSYFLSVPGPTLSEKMCSFYFANTYFLTVLDFPEEVARADVSGKAWKCSEKERGSEFEYLWGMGSSLGARLNGSLLWWVTVHSVLFDSWGGWPQSQQFKPRPVQRKKKKRSSGRLCPAPSCAAWGGARVCPGDLHPGLGPKGAGGGAGGPMCEGIVVWNGTPTVSALWEACPGAGARELCWAQSAGEASGTWNLWPLTLIRTLCAQRGMGLIAVSQVKDTFCHGLAILYW